MKTENIMIDYSDFSECGSVISHFAKITAIPRGSGNTAPIADYLVGFAKVRGLECYRDEADNVVIKKPATPSMVGRPAVIFQGHTDIVAEKLTECDIDMSTEGPRLMRDGDFLCADGTTLGADDGVALAYALALLDSDDIEHPDFEAVFTSDEEVGLLGATALDASVLRGRLMINIDSDAEGIFTVGCAGGVRCDLSLPVKRVAAKRKAYRIRLHGLQGGHSGIEIDKNRANAIKVMAEMLNTLSDISIAELVGGNADNAIPRECEAVVCADADFPEKLREAFERRRSLPAETRDFKEENAPTLTEAAPSVSLDISETEAPALMLDAESTEKLLSILATLPSGVIAMSRELAGLVETSLNLGILRLESDAAEISFSVRSAVGEEKKKLCARLSGIAKDFGAGYSERGSYPAWEYRKESHLRDVMCRVYGDLYGKAPEVVTIHAGLECGIFAGKMEGLDCISIGPDNFDIHTPKERLSLTSLARVWEFLKEVLKNI